MEMLISAYIGQFKIMEWIEKNYSISGNLRNQECQSGGWIKLGFEARLNTLKKNRNMHMNKP